MKHLVTLSFLLLSTSSIISAQQTAAPAQQATQNVRRRPVEVPDPNAPATKYDYHDLFAPFFCKLLLTNISQSYSMQLNDLQKS